ncbi:MAG: rhomboid family intramembrane serine protease [Candidatus Eisenbacteria bacterium]|uniref:Rhomboid family intramembrane serine protease n=1 Tax=Eiseniibacteriota bacterium TaxID=2212470 RepID=A0A948W5Z6_UNCEI|nr:rhomboid family intramembrane serine protease [Candidatus Eisenbacteria bacterium]MBU1948241.1 rhomboid family intramembrane serine protease [Candidatus Eisenbacteria bacterium]MBU2690565.1 rhomboid family intramembrane serine protease [Candidatus Eisenbacteria bacterium]
MAFRQSSGVSFGPRISPAVKMIMIWNVIFYLLQQLLGSSMTRYAGLIPYSVMGQGFLWQPITYMFLHGGLFHLLFNMFALWMFGSELEYQWGTKRWVKYYFLTGIGAGLTTIAFAYVAIKLGFGNPRAIYIPTIGASGAIYGLLLAFGLTFPNRPILLYFLFPIPARIFVLIFGAIEFISSVSQSDDGISHIAHLGGMVFGYIFLKGWPGGSSRDRWRRDKLRSSFRIIEGDDSKDDSPWT